MSLCFVARLPSPISSRPKFSLIFFLLPMQLLKPLLPCTSHTTVTFQPIFVPADSIPAHLDSASAPLRGSPCLLPLCVSPLASWAQPGAPIQTHWSPATHCLLSHMLGWTVLAPEDCTGLLSTFALWDSFPWDPADQVPEQTEFVPMKSRAIILLFAFLTSFRILIGRSDLPMSHCPDSLGNAAI